MSAMHSSSLQATALLPPLCALLLAAACAGTLQPIAVPEPLRPGADQTLAMIVPARGVQIYECRTRKDRPSAYGWAFVAPEAELFDTRGRPIGRHYAGPHWESNDGSKIVATLKERADSADADAIAWLLLAARPIVAHGAFGPVTSIQRVNTTGGKSPVAGCSETTVGTTARVAYTADYYFFTPR